MPHRNFSDPVHGFISTASPLLLDLLQTPEVQRLRRVRQLGVGYLVFPGAEHSRFGHALGAMALMQDALHSLRAKGTPISEKEEEAAMAAALLHDVGHGPFSHTLEHELIADFEHEDMSRAILETLNIRFNGALDITLAIFDGTYPRPFFHQLISSQLDMDRLDYLRRDAFYTGVAEGVVGVDRLIKTMRVVPTEGGPGSKVVIEAKGTYAVENFILARRLMYWQVYLHKSVLTGDFLLQSAFARIRARAPHHPQLAGSKALLFFLQQQLAAPDISSPQVREAFCALDDTDVLFSLKQWMHDPDPVLADLSRRFINRDFFRVTFLPAPPSATQRLTWQNQVADWLVSKGLCAAHQADALVPYYFMTADSRHAAYQRQRDSIFILDRNGRLQELSEVAEATAIASMTKPVVKPYVCAPKAISLPGPASSQ